MQGGGDDTALNGIKLYCYDINGNYIDPISHKGPWSNNEAPSSHCDKFLAGGQLRAEPPGRVSDTTYVVYKIQISAF